MKSNCLALLILLMCISISNAQTSDRFIRIIGNAKQTLSATHALIGVNIAEQQPNEYKQIPYMPFEAVYTNYLEELFMLNIVENQLQRNPKSTKYGTGNFKDYILQIPVHQLEQVLGIRAPGVQVTEIKYRFADSDVESSMAIAAIEDARKKAQVLCNDVKMKLGKILNIEDTSSGCCNHIDDDNINRVEKNYKVNVTFELLD